MLSISRMDAGAQRYKEGAVLTHNDIHVLDELGTVSARTTSWK